MDTQKLRIGKPAMIKTIRPTFYIGKIRSTNDVGIVLTNVGVGVEGSFDLKKAKLTVVTVPWDKILAVVQEE